MADSGNLKSAGRRQPNRLQKRAPASLQISPVGEWKAAIPLLSPLVSPTSVDLAEVISCSNSGNETTAAVAEKPAVVMKKWQHPAAPFGYEPAPFVPFVHTGISDR